MSEHPTPTHDISIVDRIMDFIARRYREPPTCGVCETEMRWIDGAWDCPNLFREAHRVETDDGWIGWTTNPRNQTESSTK